MAPLASESASFIEPQYRPVRLPPSHAQRRLWFIDQLQGGSPEYNMREAIRLIGPLDCEALMRAGNAIVQRHEILRTCFEAVDGEPIQVIKPELHIEVPVIDMSAIDEEEQREAVRSALRREEEAPFDLSRGPLVRIRVLKLSEGEHILLRTLHHIVSDAWSQGILNREFMLLYSAFVEGRENPLEALPVQYADYALWERKRLEQGKLASGLRYWTQQLAAIPAPLELAADGPRAAGQKIVGERLRVTLPAGLTTGLKQIGKEGRATMYMTMLSAFAVLLSRYSEEDDIVVGSPIGNRQDRDLEGLIGLFVNSVVMRVRLVPEMTFMELVAVVRQTALEAYEHQGVPFERLVEELSPQRAAHASPLFQVGFALRNAPAAAPEFRGLQAETLDVNLLGIHYDLDVHCSPRGNQIEMFWLYDCSLFERWRIEQMAAHYVRIIEAVTANPHTTLWAIPLLSAAEEQQSVKRGNGKIETAGDKNLPELFEVEVAKTPDAIAIVYGERAITYCEVNQQANRLAHYLRSRGVGADDFVGILLDRSPEMIIAILGVLKSGAGYLPLDPAYPHERLSFMLTDARPAIVITKTCMSLPDQVSVPHLLLDDPEMSGSIEQCSSGNPADLGPVGWLSPANAAYAIYTSGSTGEPKGVVITHRNVVRLFEATKALFSFGPKDVWTMFHSFGFDFSVWELWGALLYGGKLVLVEPLMARSPEEFLKLLISEKVTILSQTPSAFYELARIESAVLGDGRLSSLRRIVFGGEALNFSRLEEWYGRYDDHNPRLVNMYGITETTVHVTYAELDKKMVQECSSSFIGRPIADLRVYVLDRRLRVVPTGVAGEVYVAGEGLGRGYLNRPGLTAERFVADPYGEEAGTRMYRTGDRARWRLDGSLDYLGRTDLQVKVRGFRIETREIEAVLKQQAGVQEAVVVLREEGGEKRLAGYVVAAADAYVDGSELRQQLRRKLPEYMVPAAVMVLEALPLTVNGKLDRKALPKPEYSRTGEYRPPRVPEEEILCGLFAEVLGVESVGLGDNFFELGGHSLMVTRLVSRIRSTLDVEVPIRMLFEAPSVEQLSSRLRHGDGTRLALKPQPRPERLPLSYAQQRLWFIDQLQCGSAEYNILQALHLEGNLDLAALERALGSIVERHEVLRTRLVAMDGEPAQVIEPEVQLKLAIEDLSDLGPEAQKVAIHGALSHEVQEPFDLSRGPLLRTRVLKLAEQEHLLLQTIHHIVFDGWSEEIFHRELRVLYKAYLEGRGNPLSPLSVQYADYTLWQRKLLEGEKLESGLAYWKKQLEGMPEQLNLPTDRPRRADRTLGAGVCQATLTGKQVTALKSLSRENNATLYMTLLTAFAVLLAHYSGQDDIVVGSPIANRQDAKLEELIGFFVNSLVMRVRVARGMSFMELLAEVRRTALEAYEHQDIPFERLVEELSPKRVRNTTPLLQVQFATRQVEGAAPELEHITVSPLRRDELRVRFDLEVLVSVSGDQLALDWRFQRSLFDHWRIEQMLRHYMSILDAVTVEEAECAL